MTDQPPRRSKRLHTAKSLEKPPSPETPRRAQSSRKPIDSDYDYRPSPDAVEPTNGVYVSPKRNIAWKEDVKPEARQAVVEDSVHGVSCAICRDSNQNGRTFETAHVLDKGLAGHQETIKLLERNWGLEPGTFFLHSRFNLFILCPKCHTLLDKNIIGLLPPTQVINIAEQFVRKPAEERAKYPVSKIFKHDPDNPHQYRLIDIHWKGDDPLGVYVRNKKNKVKIIGVDPPFDHPLLSRIELHVNPFYMIWNLGAKLQDVADIRSLNVPDWAKDELLRVHLLFQAWEIDPDDQAAASGTGAAQSATEPAISAPQRVRSVTSGPDVALESVPDATTSVRRSKRGRVASNAHSSTVDVDVPPPPKRGKTTARASRR